MSEHSRTVAYQPVHQSHAKQRIRPFLVTSLMVASLIVASLAFAAQPTRANTPQDEPTTTIVVDSLLDLPDTNPGNGICESDGGGCTLRAAIETAQGGFWPGADTIDLSGLSGTIFMNFGVYPAISEDLTITGPADADTLWIDATGEHQHFVILSGVTVEITSVRLNRGFGSLGGSISTAGVLTLSAVVITNSSAFDDGGAIYSAPGSTTTIRMGSEIGRFDFSNTAQYGGAIYNDDGTVYIDDSSINNNSATYNGGGIYNYAGSVYVDNYSVIENNYAGDYGGGIYNIAGGLVEISSSTITDNQADADGGGIYNFYSTQTLTNATISGNSAKGNGGGILEESTDTANLYNVTVTNNVADSDADGIGNGGGIFVTGFINIANSIAAQNEDRSPGTSPIHPDCSVGLVFYTSTNTHNLVGNGEGCTTLFVNGASGNQVGTPSSPLDAVLGPLVFDPSGALMHAILNGSPAKDAGDPTGCKDDLGALLPDDQRGITRPQGLYCDIGAYEAIPPVIENQSFSVAEFSPNGTLVGTVAASDADGSIVSFAITAGNTDGAFAIDSAGTLTVANSAAINPAVNPSFALTVVVTDNDGYTASATMTVTVTADPFIVRNTNDAGTGSLRAAILAANAAPGVDAITFAIDGVGPHIITPTASLPVIVDPVSIDGSSQPSGSVELDGSLAGPDVDGLFILSYSTTIRGLTIKNFTGAGIFVDYSTHRGGPYLNLIEGNTITGNGEEGVMVSLTQQATIRANNIYDNGLLGIDLGGNGVTPNDVGDPDVGPNLYQNYPVLLRAEPGKGFWVEGRLNSLANLDFTLDFFASATCDPTGFGEGQHYLGTRSTSTDADGNARFGFGLPYPPEDSPFMTATATDENGNTSEFSQCIVTGPSNDSWPRAYRLDLVQDQAASATFSQYVDKLGQSRWYKFQVEPDSKVTIELSNLPVNYDIVIYKDIAAVYEELTNPQNQGDLQQLNAEFAPDMYSPDMYSPDMYSPDMYSPDMYSPDMYSPDMYSPDMYSPDVFAPDMYSPDMYSPDMYSPDMYSPDEHNPNTFDPNTFDPNAPVPDPQAYASAQNRSIIAFSSRTGTADERAVVNTWTRTGDFYVRVRGRNGVSSLASPFTVNVSIQPGLCQNLDTALVPGSLQATSGNFHTIILVDPTRMAGSPADINAMLAKLAQLAARPDVQGVVVTVGQDDRVAAANLQADQKVECPEAKNLVADAVKQIVQRYKALNPLEYVVIVGNDNTIPFFRTPDQALLASEINYVPPVFNNTQSQASLRLGYVLTQDPYGSEVDISYKNHTIPVPNLAVGRLVETPSDVMRMVDAYLTTTGGVVAAPNNAFVSGYDFLTDAAEAVQAELEAGIGQPADTLIAPRDQAPQDPLAWTGEQLEAQFLGSRHDLNYLAGHFSAATALAADYTTRMTTADVLSSTVDLENAIIFSAGCHSGYSIVNADAVPQVTREPDWAQAFAMKGATLIAGTGYQYGDTDFVEYSERLYLEFAKHLRYGSGPVSLGKALVGAKQTYLEDTARMRGIHEKSVLEATLFGLPMLKVDLPFGRINPPIEPPVVTGTSGFASNPGLTLGLRAADLTIIPALTEHTRVLSNTSALTQTITATYLEGGDGVALNPVEPALPLETRNVTVAGKTLRGIGFHGGSYTDQANVVPLTSAPATEIRGIHFPFRAQAFYPVRPWDANYFNALSQASGGITKLVVMPAQLKANNLTDIEATLREYSDMDFRLYYSDNVASYPETNVPALAAPPEIAQVTSITDTTTVTFTVLVTSDPSVGVQEVWVTYTGAIGPFYGAWQSLDLTQDLSNSTVWTSVLTLPPGQTWDNVRFTVQAVNGVGLVTLVTNFGNYFIPGIDPGQTSTTAQPTSLTLISPPASGTYGTSVTFNAQLESEAARAGGIPGQIVEFSYGSQRRQVVTNASGRATVSFPLIGLVGQDVIQVSFAGSTAYKGSSASSAFTIYKQSTSLTLTPEPAAGQYSDDTNLQATLIAGADRRLTNTTVFFVAGTVAETLSATSTNITDYAGRAPAGPVNLPAGVYPVTAYFLGTIPVGGGQTVTLSDSRFITSTGTGSLAQTAKDATVAYTGATSVASGAAIDAAATVTQADDGMPGDLTLAQVQYVVRNGANQIVATVTGPVTLGGLSIALIPGLPDGVYSLTVQVVGGYFASPVSAPVLISVSVPTAVKLSGMDASGSASAMGWPWLIALIGLASAVAVWVKRSGGKQRTA